VNSRIDETDLVERATAIAWENNRQLAMLDGMDMPYWKDAELDVKQRWRSNIRLVWAFFREMEDKRK
jgi:hypothetical protein